MQIRRVGNDQDFKALEAIWAETLESSVAPNVFLTFPWFRTWWKNLSGQQVLEILVFQDEKSGIYGLAPLMRQGNGLSFLASQEVTDYCDFIFPSGQEPRFFDEFLQFLEREFSRIDKLELINIPETSPTLVCLAQAAEKQGWVCLINESEETPQLPLPSDYEEYLRGLRRKCRHELRRKLRKTESLSDLRIEKYVAPTDIENRIDEFMILHKNSSPDKAEFWEHPGMESFFFDLSLGFAKEGWLELRVLYSQQQTLASLLSFVYGNVLSFYNMAFNQDYAAYSPGYYLFDRSLRDAIVEKRREADFLRGSEKYKYEFGAQKSKIYNLILER